MSSIDLATPFVHPPASPAANEPGGSARRDAAPAWAAQLRSRPLWHVLAALSLAAIGFGAACFAYEHHSPELVTSLRSIGSGGAAWGLYIVFVVFFIGVSFAGITVASLARLFGISTLKPVTRIAELLTLVSLVAGATCVVADLGRPLHGIMNLPRFANPHSPFFGTFTLVVSGYLFSSLVYFFLSGRKDAQALAATGPRGLRWFYRLWASGYHDSTAERRRHVRTSFWLSLGILPLLVVAHSTLGLVFGIQSGRPGWFSALQPPAFVLLAGVSGTGMLILVVLGLRWLYRLEDQIPMATIRWLGNALWILTLAYLYFMIVEDLTATYAAPRADRNVAHVVVAGHYAPLFWSTVGCLAAGFFIPFSMYLRKATSAGWIAAAAVLVNVAAVGKRFLLVVPSQTHGAALAVQKGQYFPTWVEMGFVVGLLGLVTFVFLMFGRSFRLVPTGRAAEVEDAAEEAAPARDPRRGLATSVWILGALTLIGFALGDSFRLWSHGSIDPSIPGSPLAFAAGVMLLFGAAVFYELLPERRPRAAVPRVVAATPPRIPAGVFQGLQPGATA